MTTASGSDPTRPARLLIVSPFVLPHMGGVERVTAWAAAAMPAYGFDVRTLGHDIGGGVADATWPSHREPLGIPIPDASRRAWRTLRDEVSRSDVVLIQNVFWPLSNLTGVALYRIRRPALTLIHANSSTPVPGQAAVIRAGEWVHAHSLAKVQLRYAPPLAICRSSESFVATHYHRRADVLPLPLPGGLRAPMPIRGARLPLRIVFSARLAPMKAPADAIRACAIAREQIPLQLDVYGDGPAMRSLVAAPDWVTFHGARPWDEATAAVSDADLFLSSSITDVAQTSLLEALCLGIPSVATDVGEAPDYLCGRLAAGLAPPGAPEALASAIVAVAQNYLEVREATVARAVELRAAHDGDRIAALLAGYLRRAVEAGRARRA